MKVISAVLASRTTIAPSQQCQVSKDWTTFGLPPPPCSVNPISTTRALVMEVSEEEPEWFVDEPTSAPNGLNDPEGTSDPADGTSAPEMGECDDQEAEDFLTAFHEDIVFKSLPCFKKINNLSITDQKASFCSEPDICQEMYDSVTSLEYPDCTLSGVLVKDKYPIDEEAILLALGNYLQMTSILFCGGTPPDGVCTRTQFLEYNEVFTNDVLEHVDPCLDLLAMEAPSNATAYCGKAERCLTFFTAFDTFTYPSCTMGGQTIQAGSRARTNFDSLATRFDTTMDATCGGNSCAVPILVDLSSEFNETVNEKYEPCALFLKGTPLDTNFCADTDVCKTFFTALNGFEYPNCTWNGRGVNEKYGGTYSDFKAGYNTTIIAFCSFGAKSADPNSAVALLAGLLSMLYVVM